MKETKFYKMLSESALGEALKDERKEIRKRLDEHKKQLADWPCNYFHSGFIAAIIIIIGCFGLFYVIPLMLRGVGNKPLQGAGVVALILSIGMILFVLIKYFEPYNQIPIPAKPEDLPKGDEYHRRKGRYDNQPPEISREMAKKWWFPSIQAIIYSYTGCPHNNWAEPYGCIYRNSYSWNFVRVKLNADDEKIWSMIIFDTEYYNKMIEEVNCYLWAMGEPLLSMIDPKETKRARYMTKDERREVLSRSYCDVVKEAGVYSDFPAALYCYSKWVEYDYPYKKDSMGYIISDWSRKPIYEYKRPKYLRVPPRVFAKAHMDIIEEDKYERLREQHGEERA